MRDKSFFGGAIVYLLCDRSPVDIVGLEELRTLPHSLRVLNNDPNGARGCPVSNLDPVSADGCLGRQIDGDCGNGVSGRIAIQLGDQEIVVFHAEGKLLHVDIIDGSWEREKGNEIEQ